MDALTIIGLVFALVAIVGGQWLGGGALGSLFQVTAFLIVVGGTLGAVLLQTPLSTFTRALRLARWIFRPPVRDGEAAIQRIVRWAHKARTEGMLGLESELPRADDDFIRNGLQMLVDGFDPDRIREAMEIEINAYDDRQRKAARVWEAAGGYAPTLGILGAVLGLIHVMENLSDPTKLGSGIAVAFVATVYGVASANLFFLPVAGKLQALIQAHVAHRELVVDGLLGIANGENPKLIEARLRGFLA